jgi:uncharacterized membrane protein YphA (DoxX/SURF4 family)
MNFFKNKVTLVPFLVDGICFCFILLFVYAATSKLGDYQKFHVQIGQSPLLSPFSEWVTWVIPFSELGIAILLAFQRFRAMAMYAAFTLMVLFTAYIFAITHYIEYVPCSCGGILEHMNWNQHFYFNLFFVMLAVIGIFFMNISSGYSIYY